MFDFLDLPVNCSNAQKILCPSFTLCTSAKARVRSNVSGLFYSVQRHSTWAPEWACSLILHAWHNLLFNLMNHFLFQVTFQRLMKPLASLNRPFHVYLLELVCEMSSLCYADILAVIIIQLSERAF